MINEFGECHTKIVNCHCGRGEVLPLPLHLGVGVVGGGGGGWWGGGVSVGGSNELLKLKWRLGKYVFINAPCT